MLPPNQLMNIRLENVPCNLCGSTEWITVINREDLNTHIDGIFQLVRCKICGLVYQNPRPLLSEWDFLYPEQYDQFTNITTEEFQNNIFFRYGLKKRLRNIEKYVAGGNICDLGSATGDFLREVKIHTEWQGFGIEPSQYASDLARNYGLNVFNGTLEDGPFPGINFDVITMWNVIEHLPDPLRTLKLAYRRLKPGGILVVTTPNLDSFDAHLFGKYWIGYELPRHYYVFSITSLSKFLDQIDFHILGYKCLYGEHAAAMSSLKFWLRAKHPILGDQLGKFLFSLPIRIVMAPFFLLSDSTKKSSPITIFAQKPKENHDN